MDVVAGLIKLKENAMQDVDAWQKEINQRKDEAIETLKNEGVTIESWFHIQLEGSDYLMVYMRANDIQKAQQVAQHSQSDIDQFHKNFKKVWGERILGTLLVDLDNT